MTPAPEAETRFGLSHVVPVLSDFNAISLRPPPLYNAPTIT